MTFNRDINRDEAFLEELSLEKLNRIRWQTEALIRRKEGPAIQRIATGGQERIIKLQLKAFQRIPSEIIADYMTAEERREYEILVDAYSKY